MGQLDGKAILITGATSGLGAEFARALAGEGATVVITGRRADRLEKLAGEIAASGGVAHAHALDVTDMASIAACVSFAWDATGGLWGLVNNSGVARVADAQDTPEADYDLQMDTNVKGAFFMAGAVARRMIDAGQGGRIVNIASIAAFRALAKNAVYCMSKAAVAHMTTCMAREWARHDINVNAICPGYIKTEINAGFFDSPAGEDFIRRFPRRRLGEPGDLTGLLTYLMSDAARIVTGALIPLDDAQSL